VDGISDRWAAHDEGSKRAGLPDEVQSQRGAAGAGVKADEVGDVIDEQQSAPT
jgi:hypothetical protein